MGDVFMERMVKRKMEGVDYLIVEGVIVGVLVVAMVGMVVGTLILGFPMLSLLIAAGAAFLIYRHFQFPEPALTALLLVILGELRAVRKLDDHKAELWARLRKLSRTSEG